MKPVIGEARTTQERDAVFRFRYDIYVEEMGRYRSIADHARRMLVEAEDATARLYLASEGERVVATMRHNWGGDAPFAPRQATQYSLEPFLALVPPEQIVVGERFMVAASQRGTDLIFRLFQTYLNFVNDRRIQFVFGDCEPHLLNLYLGMGFRTFAITNLNSTETGYLIPLVMVPEDLAYMRKIGSPLLNVLRDFGADAQVPVGIDELLSSGGAVLSQTMTPGAVYRAEIEQAMRLAENPAQLLDGLTPEEQQRCIAKCNVIKCRLGDHLIKKGNVAQNMFVVLSGGLEVRDGERVIGVCGSGTSWARWPSCWRAPARPTYLLHPTTPGCCR